MYYGAALSIMGGMLSTPLRSMLSKCVESHEYGKVFTLSSTASSIASLCSSVIIQKLYSWTVEDFPGAIYLFHATIELITICMMTIMYFWVNLHEKRFGLIGYELV